MCRRQHSIARNQHTATEMVHAGRSVSNRLSLGLESYRRGTPDRSDIGKHSLKITRELSLPASRLNTLYSEPKMNHKAQESVDKHTRKTKDN